MTQQEAPSATVLEKLYEIDTRTVTNTIEKSDIPLHNEVFVSGTALCQFPKLDPMLACALTARIRTASAPIKCESAYFPLP
jgi:hypothetical protein